MSQASDAGKLNEEFKQLFNKTVQGNMNLSKRLSTMFTNMATEFYAGRGLKALPSVGEGLTRLAELNLSYWSAAVDHSLAFANSVAGTYEKTFDLKATGTEKGAAARPITKTRSRKSPKGRGKTRT
jgi:hypothetical protein